MGVALMGEAYGARFMRRSHVVASPGEYVKCRLFITADNDSRSAILVVSIAELEQARCVN